MLGGDGPGQLDAGHDGAVAAPAVAEAAVGVMGLRVPVQADGDTETVLGHEAHDGLGEQRAVGDQVERHRDRLPLGSLFHLGNQRLDQREPQQRLPAKERQLPAPPPCRILGKQHVDAPPRHLHRHGPLELAAPVI